MKRFLVAAYQLFFSMMTNDYYASELTDFNFPEVSKRDGSTSFDYERYTAAQKFLQTTAN